MIKLLSRLSRSTLGASTIEMGLILAMIVLAMMGALRTFSAESVGMWTNIQNKTANAIHGTSS